MTPSILRTARIRLNSRPAGALAGTPSADAFGPRRVLIKVRLTDQTVQEYQDTNGVWTAVGAPFEASGIAPPNLTPNGLTMVYASEGFRSTLVPRCPHLSRSAIWAALLLFDVFFLSFGLRQFRRKAIL